MSSPTYFTNNTTADNLSILMCRTVEQYAQHGFLCTRYTCWTLRLWNHWVRGIGTIWAHSTWYFDYTKFIICKIQLKILMIIKLTLSKNLLDQNPNENKSYENSKTDCDDQTDIVFSRFAWKIVDDWFFNCCNHSSRTKFVVVLRLVKFNAD